MIIHLKKGTPTTQINEIARKINALHFTEGDQEILVTSCKIKELPGVAEHLTAEHFVMDTDIQLASRAYRQHRTIRIGDLVIGGGSNHTLMIAGPCSVESHEQITQSAELLKKLGISTLRGGCFKPRTSPYTFQGMGKDGLELLMEMREKYDLKIITEVKDSSHVDMVIESADIVQIGAKAMYDQSILRKCGQSQKPILLKRGFASTLQECVQAAEFILSKGNPNVMLCERGIRTFETKSRFTLDLTGVAYLKEYTNLPVIVDPSHAMGYRYGVPDLTRAATAMGVDGLLIETHPTPQSAKSDAAQQLDFDEFEKMYHSLQPVATAVGRKLI